MVSRRMLCPDTGKSIYFSNREARSAIKLFQSKGTRSVLYRCRHCHYLHLTSKIKKQGKRLGD